MAHDSGGICPIAAGELAELFPAGTALAVATMDMYAAPLLTGEDRFSGRAAETRRREFAAGRAAARAALSKLGLAALPIPANPDRTPQWPAGYVGSITHCDGFCAAAVAQCREVAGIGFDAEPARPLPHELERRICSGEELRDFSALPALVAWPKLAFSAKEAFYKCFFPIVRAHLNFQDIAVRFQATGDGQGSFEIRSAGRSDVMDFLTRATQARWRSSDGLVFTSFACRP